jgi:hypothetical protein
MSTNESIGSNVVVIGATKSIGVSILLTVLFGPLGMFYSTTSGALIMLVASLIVGIVTVGVGLLVTWPIAIIWGAVATDTYNKKLLGRR